MASTRQKRVDDSEDERRNYPKCLSKARGTSFVFSSDFCSRGLHRPAPPSTLQRGDVLDCGKGALLRRRCAPLTQPARAAVLEMSMGGERSAGSPSSDNEHGNAPVRVVRTATSMQPRRPQAATTAVFLG
jgi:hypothetical protein